MKILHLVPGLNDPFNGIFVAAKLIADSQRKNGDVVDMLSCTDRVQGISEYDEVWVHSMWMPQVWKACIRVLKARNRVSSAPKGMAVPKLVRMTHANLDPVRYHFHGCKKFLVSPIERWLFSKTNHIVVTCNEERDWCVAWGLKNEFQLFDLKKCFPAITNEPPNCISSSTKGPPNCISSGKKPLNVLYLGRRHPLKGIEFLEQAMDELNRDSPGACRLRIVSDHTAERLEGDWKWCDVLCLPTLSENFGLVVAEAIERGKRVVVTDGAPVWRDIAPSQGIYIAGYRAARSSERVILLKNALRKVY